LDILWFFAQRQRPIHFRKFPVSTALARQFCKNGQTSVLFTPCSDKLPFAASRQRSAYRGQRTGAPSVPFKPSLFQRTRHSRRPSDHTTARCGGTRWARAAPAGAKRFKSNDVWVVRRIRTRPAGQGVAQNTVEFIDLVSAKSVKEGRGDLRPRRSSRHAAICLASWLGRDPRVETKASAPCDVERPRAARGFRSTGQLQKGIGAKRTATERLLLADAGSALPVAACGRGSTLRAFLRVRQRTPVTIIL
jgi:hypothetical protein